MTRKRVVLIDNQRLYRECLRDLLNKNGHYTVVGESDKGGSGINTIKTVEADVILLDLIPSVSGYDALKEVREATQVPIMILSMEDKPEVIRRIFDMGADGFCAKDASLKELLKSLAKTLVGEKPVYLNQPKSQPGVCEFD